MIRSAVTISLVPQAKGGPFVFWDDLQGSMFRAKELGFDAVELFLPGPEAVGVHEIRRFCDETGLSIAAVGTGAGMVVHKLSLTDPDPHRRSEAREFVRRMIRFGGELGAPAIIGSMQGRWTPEIGRDPTLEILADQLHDLGDAAAEFSVPLIYEPLNRYETNLCNTMAQGVALIEGYRLDNVKILADLFHMNIEETTVPQGIRDCGPHLGHLHFVDSNRRPAGCGHLDYGPIVAALRDIQFAGFASAEAFPWPDSDAAAQTTIQTFRTCFRS